MLVYGFGNFEFSFTIVIYNYVFKNTYSIYHKQFKCKIINNSKTILLYLIVYLTYLDFKLKSLDFKLKNLDFLTLKRCLIEQITVLSSAKILLVNVRGNVVFKYNTVSIIPVYYESSTC